MGDNTDVFVNIFCFNWNIIMSGKANVLHVLEVAVFRAWTDSFCLAPAFNRGWSCMLSL